MLTWLSDNWLNVAIPLLAFLATYIVGLWLRGVVYGAFARWKATTKWQGSKLVIVTVRRTFIYWFLLLGLVIAIGVSVLPAQVKSLSSKVIGSLFVLSLVWVVIRLGEHLLRLYLPRVRITKPTILLSVNVLRIVVIVIGVLAVLDIWGMPTTPLLLFIGVVALVAALSLRNVAPNVFAGFQLNSTRQIKVGDYVKLETGEEGYVQDMGWSTTRIKGLGESFTIIPNTRLLQNTVINYGRPLRRANQPFRFFSRSHLTELTGLKASNLRELLEILKTAPDSIVYYHTHHFLEHYHYLSPEPANDFAVWVSNSLGDEVLGERLASIDTFSFSNLAALKQRLVGVMEESLTNVSVMRTVMPGEEFYFMKSVSVILPTNYVANDLREFVEILRRTSLGSLYYHIFESRLRLGRGMNDFSTWMRGSLGEPDLGDEIARIDPYTYTLEGLRLVLIQLIEKRIK